MSSLSALVPYFIEFLFISAYLGQKELSFYGTQDLAVVLFVCNTFAPG